MKAISMTVFRFVLTAAVAWAGPAAAQGGGVADTAPAVPAQSFAAALSPAQWKQVENCVDRALAWLATQQAPDGSFRTSSQGQPAITALCVLAFLSRGHQPGFGPYGAQMDRAIDFVISCQKPDGLFSFEAPDDAIAFNGRLGRGMVVRGGQAGTYNHAIAGLMLGEVFGHASAQRTKVIKKAMDKALLFTRQLQTRPKDAPEDQGGWRYLQIQFNGADSDLSVTGWHLMFLRSARNAEFNVPQRYIDDAMNFVHRCWVDEEGLFHYTAQGSQSSQYQYTRGLMGSAIVSLSLAGQHQSRQALAAGDWLLAHPFQYYGETVGRGDRFIYSTYYCSQAAAQLGGRYWTGIYPPIAAVLVRGQETDGSFPVDLGMGGGRGRGFGGEAAYGPTYSTAMAVLSLTPAYQLLPVYQR
jgi:hypothetical protein